MAKSSAVDIGELARFVLTGVISGLGNVSAVWMARPFVSFEVALPAGVVAGLAISFTLSKLFAFGSRSWARAGGEAWRFLIVYAVSCAIYMTTAVIIGRFLLGYGLMTKAAETCGILVGAGTMTFTSYFGHRFFTYRTYFVPPTAEVVAGMPLFKPVAGIEHR
jgi:putative flippase GtrA